MLVKNGLNTQIPRAAKPAATNAPKTEKAPADNVTLGGYKDVGWLDVGKGLVGAVAAAGIETVGNTLSSIPQAVSLAVEGEIALAKNETIGPWLKGGVGLLALAAVPLSVAATAVGSLGFGLYRGFTEGLENGVGGAITAAAKDVKDFNTKLCASARKEIREFGDEKLADGEKPFDVSPGRALIGLGAGVLTTGQGAAQFGWTTAKNIPGAFVQANKAISESDASRPLKTAGHILSAPLAAVALPLGFIGGAAVGLGMGVYEGYREGFTESFKEVNELNSKYSEWAREALAEAGEEIIER